MNKEQIKKALASLTIAGLTTGVSLAADGCKSKSSCGEGSCSKKEAADSLKKEKGSCGQAAQDSTKGSCGQAAKDDTTKKGSCG